MFSASEPFNPRQGLASLMQRLRMLPPALIALGLQLVALGSVLLLAELVRPQLEMPVLGMGVICGMLAAILSAGFGLPRWWIVIQLGFTPALLLLLSLQLNPNWFLAIFGLLLVVFWSTFRSRVPLYLSSRMAWQEVAKLLPEHSNTSLLDLGSGLGGMLGYLAKLRPDAHFSGVETAPLPCLLSHLRLIGRKNCHVSWDSFWEHDLGAYDVVYAYLSPVPMERLWKKAKSEMHPGALLVSNTFIVPGVEPSAYIQLADFHGSTLYIWRM